VVEASAGLLATSNYPLPPDNWHLTTFHQPPATSHWPLPPGNWQLTNDIWHPTDNLAIPAGIRAIPATRQPGIRYNTMMTMYQVVLDTNVVVSALRSRLGASHKLLSLVGMSDRFQIS